MITNEDAVRSQLKIISSNVVKRKEKLHDKNWDVTLLDNNKLCKLTNTHGQARGFPRYKVYDEILVKEIN